MIRTIGAHLALIMLLTTPVTALQQPDAAMIPPIDFERWARFVVYDMFDTQPHERYVLMTDPTYFPELTDALRAAFLEARAVELGTILFDGPRVSGARRAERPRTADSAYRGYADEAMRSLYERADIFLWLPYRYGVGSEAGVDRRLLEHLVEGTSARGSIQTSFRSPARSRSWTSCETRRPTPPIG